MFNFVGSLCVYCSKNEPGSLANCPVATKMVKFMAETGVVAHIKECESFKPWTIDAVRAMAWKAERMTTI